MFNKKVDRSVSISLSTPEGARIAEENTAKNKVKAMKMLTHSKEFLLFSIIDDEGECVCNVTGSNGKKILIMMDGAARELIMHLISHRKGDDSHE